jgi:carboxypeptidase family protein
VRRWQRSVCAKLGKSHGRFLQAILVVGLSASCSATTCIALKKFKVRQVCGQVVTPAGDVIPDATVQVRKKGESMALSTHTDTDGNFKFDRIFEGEYEIEVDVPGFRSALQEFEVARPKKAGRCVRPLVALMHVGGGCSSVAKTARKNIGQ